MSDEHATLQAAGKDKLSGAGIVLVAPDGRVVTVKAEYKTYWTFPGGKIEPQEHIKAAAIRETEEEVGVTLHPGDVRLVLTASQCVDGMFSYYFLFEAAVNEERINKIRLAKGEIAEYDLIDLSKLDEDNRTYSILMHYYAQGKRGYCEFDLSRLATH